MEVSLILRVLPCYIGCHYYLMMHFFNWTGLERVGGPRLL